MLSGLLFRMLHEASVAARAAAGKIEMLPARHLAIGIPGIFRIPVGEQLVALHRNLEIFPSGIRLDRLASFGPHELRRAGRSSLESSGRLGSLCLRRRIALSLSSSFGRLGCFASFLSGLTLLLSGKPAAAADCIRREIGLDGLGASGLEGVLQFVIVRLSEAQQILIEVEAEGGTSGVVGDAMAANELADLIEAPRKAIRILHEPAPSKAKT